MPSVAVREELERDDGVDRRLPDDGLQSRTRASPSLVVGDVVEVGLPRPPVLAEPGDERPRAGLARHALAECRRVGERSGHDVARRDVGLHPDWFLRVESEFVKRLQRHSMNSSPRPYLKVTLTVDPARHEEHLVLGRSRIRPGPIPSGKSKTSGSEKGAAS